MGGMGAVINFLGGGALINFLEGNKFLSPKRVRAYKEGNLFWDWDLHRENIQ